jgi:DNA-binding NtrC family response regulator
MQVEAALADARCAVHTSATFADIPRDAARLRPDLAVLPVCGGASHAAFATVERLHAADRALPIIFVTSTGSEALLLAALRAGVQDYFCNPLDSGALAASVRRLVCVAPPRGDRPARSPNVRRAIVPHPLVGDSASMRDIKAHLDRLADTDSNVLITGETGTGKELAAELIHFSSSRARRRFVTVNCAAIPDTLLESELFGYERGAFTGATVSRGGVLQQAQGGTVFLDEVGDMSALAQAKVLRAIETREIVPLGGRASVPLDLRIIAATNHDLERTVSEGRFRRDLYFRLNVVRVRLPPLRERRADIPALLAYYIRHFAGATGRPAAAFTAEALSALRRYAWPGNVRELKNLVEAIFALGVSTQVGLDHLPREFADSLAALADGDAAERERLLAALLEARWNKSRAARQLRCSRMTLYRRMLRLQVGTSDRS